MKKIIFILLFFCCIECYCQNENCYTHGPIYYTISVVNLYEDMSVNSAIALDIPKGAPVIITESFFGDNGWWQICYNGDIGWVKKKLLSRKAPLKKATPVKTRRAEEIIDSTASINVGFNPFLAKTISAANFRTAPSTTSSHIIKKLPLGTQLYVVSRTQINNFYKVIDIESAKIGWVSIELLKETEKVNINSSQAFTETGTTMDYRSSIEITNKSSLSIILIVDNETFTLEPHSTEIISVIPSKSYYIATAPNVVPASGFQNFESYHSYKWQFWVETKRN